MAELSVFGYQAKSLYSLHPYLLFVPKISLHKNRYFRKLSSAPSNIFSPPFFMSSREEESWVCPPPSIQGRPRRNAGITPPSQCFDCIFMMPLWTFGLHFFFLLFHFIFYYSLMLSQILPFSIEFKSRIAINCLSERVSFL